ncbi:uncharacterized protein CLUP02_13115 [Colletotrichum lupini]|uniref:Uncharacterized protein n=1 Tax=Colletotrichum lupini TaxID=145971 RepID=A0A9Q8T1S9_9PEZI|nr:uncharacterized protein CLUP02_13115 [Colletotrichum lupini]UQC87597.1 hypothetical protein CLUP02_13115 [Colletotrichum lupini]
MRPPQAGTLEIREGLLAPYFTVGSTKYILRIPVGGGHIDNLTIALEKQATVKGCMRGGSGLLMSFVPPKPGESRLRTVSTRDGASVSTPFTLKEKMNKMRLGDRGVTTCTDFFIEHIRTYALQIPVTSERNHPQNKTTPLNPFRLKLKLDEERVYDCNSTNRYCIRESGSEKVLLGKLEKRHSVCGYVPLNPLSPLSKALHGIKVLPRINIETIGRSPVDPQLGIPETANLIIRVCNCNSAIPCCGVFSTPLDELEDCKLRVTSNRRLHRSLGGSVRMLRFPACLAPASPAYLSPRDPQSPLCKATEYCLRPSRTSRRPPELLVTSVCSAAHGRCPTGEASSHPQGPVDTPTGVSLVPLPLALFLGLTINGAQCLPLWAPHP